jgi:deoxyribonuclease V
MVINSQPFLVPESIEAAHQIQHEMRAKLRIYDDFTPPTTIAGVDVGYLPAENFAHASIVLLRLEDLTILAQAQAFVPAEFPCVPGFLSFREIPAILAALEQLGTTPDMLMVDGQGIAHPRRMGIAAHLGVLLDIPSIGVGKSRLTGRFTPPGANKGDTQPLLDGAERIGTLLRSKPNTNPLFISPGHRVSLDTAVQMTLHCLTKYRLPEPTRLADKFSKCTPRYLALTSNN